MSSFHRHTFICNHSMECCKQDSGDHKRWYDPLRFLKCHLLFHLLQSVAQVIRTRAFILNWALYYCWNKEIIKKPLLNQVSVLRYTNTKKMPIYGRLNDFFQREAIVNFSKFGQKFFSQGVPTAVKFHFPTTLKLRENLYLLKRLQQNIKFQNPGGVFYSPVSSSDAHVSMLNL